jgi:hypothetical protein
MLGNGGPQTADFSFSRQPIDPWGTRRFASMRPNVIIFVNLAFDVADGIVAPALIENDMAISRKVRTLDRRIGRRWLGQSTARPSVRHPG